MLTSTDANGLVSTFATDALGRTTQGKLPDGSYVNTAYNACSSFSSVGATISPSTGIAVGACESGEYMQVVSTPFDSTGVQSAAASYKFVDVLGREHRSVGMAFGAADYIVSRSEYDAMGRLTRSSRPALGSVAYSSLQWTTNSYDSVGRSIKAVDPTGTKTTAYSGLLTTQTNQNSQQRVETRTITGEVSQIKDAAGNTLIYGLDDLGRVVSTTDPNGNQITFTLDAYGNKTRQVDPDTGTTNYIYDVLGELVWQQDSLGNITNLAYDNLGRLVQRGDPAMISYWTYDTAANGLGKLAQTSSSNNYERDYSYDTFGRLITDTTKRSIDPSATSDFTFNTTYDNASRPLLLTYPSGFSYKNIYDSTGYLQQIVDGASLLAYWTANTRDAFGHVTQETLGNGLVTTRAYDPTTELVNTIGTGTSTAPGSVQNDVYGFDAIGNLKYRNQNFGSNNLTETFGYDSLNRLTNAALSNGSTGSLKTATYDALGNISSRSDVGNYSYGATGSGPHQLKAISGAISTAFTYDAAGNMLTGNGRTYQWSSFGMPTSIAQGSTTDTYFYDANHERVRQVSATAIGTTTNVYINPRIDTGNTFEKDYLPSGVTQYVSTIYADGTPIGSAVGPAWLANLSQAPTTSTTNPTGITLPPTTSDPNGVIGYDSASQRITVTNKLSSTATYPQARGQRTYAPGQSVAFKGEITTTVNAGTNGRFIYFGVANGGGNAAGNLTQRYTYLCMRGKSVIVLYIDGNTLTSRGLLQGMQQTLSGITLADNTTYEVEIDTSPTDSTVYLYPRGQTSAQGVTYHVNMAGGWGGGGTQSRYLIVQSQSNSTEVSNTTYLGSLSEASFSTHYFHTDNLGSITATTDASGNVIERFSYDTWGKRRNIDGSDDLLSSTPWSSALTVQPSTANPNAAGYTLPASDPGSVFTWSSGQLNVNSQALSGASGYLPQVRGQRSYTPSQNVTFRTVITLGSSVGRNFLFGSLNSGSALAASKTLRYHSLYLSGTSVCTVYMDGNTTNSTTGNLMEVKSANLGALVDGGQYVIEDETTPTDSTLYIYPLGQTRAQGLSHHLYLGSWQGVSRNWYIRGSYSSTTGASTSNTTTVTSLSEQLTNLQNTIVASATDTDHGYTGHEMLDSVALIHMNGRLHDPLVGRFVSADPNIFYPDDLQDFNRYSYVHNNPLSATDPSGFDCVSSEAPSCGGYDPVQAALDSLNFNLVLKTSINTGGINLGLMGISGIPGVNNPESYNLSFSQAMTQVGDNSLADLWGQMMPKRQLLCADQCGGDGEGMEWSLSENPAVAAQQMAIDTALTASDFAHSYAQAHIMDAAIADALIQQSMYRLNHAANEQAVVNGLSNGRTVSFETSASMADSEAGIEAQASNVRLYPDGSLRTPDGKFASATGMPAPGTTTASNFAQFLRDNGVNVAGTELEVNGPLGVRRFDIGTYNSDGSIFGLEIKTGGATPTSYQSFSDTYINLFGAVGRGKIAGVPVTGTMTIYLPSGGF